MSGLVCLFQRNSSSEEREQDFQKLLVSTAINKGLSVPTHKITGNLCTAAKLDSSASLHHGIYRDDNSGSWLIASGTVLSLVGDNSSKRLLLDLLTGFIEKGERVLDLYDGHFALIIYNGIDKELSIISDPTGQFSVFYAKKGNQLFISTSAIAIANLVRSKPDNLTLQSFLRTGKTHGDRTFWEDVKQLKPANIFRITEKMEIKSEYWSPKIDRRIAEMPLTETLNYSMERLEWYFNRVLQREGKVWADLTGGFDSRMSTMVMDKIGIPFITYCVGPEYHPDVKISKLISKEMGWEYQHFSLPANWGDEQLNWLEIALLRGDSRLSVSGLAQTLYLQQIRSTTSKATVTGLGGDEWREAGYTLPNLFFFQKEYPYELLLRSGIISNIPIFVMQKNHNLLVMNEWKNYLADLIRNDKGLPNILKGNLMFIKFRYPSHGGAYLSAASGISRSLNPFCLKELINLSFSVDYIWRLNYHSLFVRSLFERENPKLANFPTKNGGPAIPIRFSNLYKFNSLWKNLFNRLFTKFTSFIFRRPIPLWRDPIIQRYPFPEWQLSMLMNAKKSNLLNPSNMYSRALYNSDKLIYLIEETINGKFINSDFLDKVITIEMAMRATDNELEMI